MPEHHHHPPTARLRFRLFINDKQVDETWLDGARPGDLDLTSVVAAEHVEAAVAADRDGGSWYVEVFDPDAPDKDAIMRFGTSRSAMILPVPIGWLRR